MKFQIRWYLTACKNTCYEYQHEPKSKKLFLSISFCSIKLYFVTTIAHSTNASRRRDGRMNCSIHKMIYYRSMNQNIFTIRINVSHNSWIILFIYFEIWSSTRKYQTVSIHACTPSEFCSELKKVKLDAISNPAGNLTEMISLACFAYNWNSHWTCSER